MTIQAALGITHGAAFDMQAVCSGFVYALSAADNFIKSANAAPRSGIGAETFSRIWTGKTARHACCSARPARGAVVVEGRRRPAPRMSAALSVRCCGPTAGSGSFYVDGGPSSTKTVGHLRMQGKEVFRFAVSAIRK